MFTRKSLAGALLLVAFGAALAAAQDTPKTALTAAKKQAGQAVGKDGDARAAELKKAVEMYKIVAEKWKDDHQTVAEAELRAAEIAAQMGDKKSAIDGAEKVIQLPGAADYLADALALKASVMKKDKDFDGAKATLLRIVKECEKDEGAVIDALLDLASIARRQKNRIEATQFAEDVIKKYPLRWRENVEAADIIVGCLVAAHEWQKADQKLAELDRTLTDRFKQNAKWGSIEKAMKSMASRRMLTATDDDDKN